MYIKLTRFSTFPVYKRIFTHVMYEWFFTYYKPIPSNLRANLFNIKIILFQLVHELTACAWTYQANFQNKKKKLNMEKKLRLFEQTRNGKRKRV